jgi:hypothetical protein
VFDELIAKGAEYVHKVDRTLVNWVVERRNMINVDIRGRACIEMVRESLFLWFCRFSCHLWVLQLLLLLDDLL